MDNEFEAVPQVDRSHYGREYDDLRRWTSYWWQFHLVLEMQLRERILEVGVGSGVVSNYLRGIVGVEVVTFDIAADLAPDVVGDVTNLPFADSEFDCVICCEVLEHLPFEEAFLGVSQLRRVARRAVISVPDADRYYMRMSVGLGSRRLRNVEFSISRFAPSVPALVPGGEHYWELNRPGYPVSRFREMLMKAGWTIDQSFRNPDFPYHHFFVLS